MDISLNFLKIQPLTNWLDYFLDRQKLFDLLENSEENETVIAQLADQFMEQALAGEREIVLLQKKIFDEEDLTYARYKNNDLWMCALACFSAFGWDLELLVKCSNVIRIRTLMGKLLKCTFLSEFDENNVNQDIFSVVCQLAPSSFSCKNVFAVWLYSTWILMVDINSRFPAPVAKPTVSNPSNQVDQNLVQAEKFQLAIGELRKWTLEAIHLLDVVVNLPINGVEVPQKECFYLSLGSDNVPSLDILRSPPMPNFNTGFIWLPALPLRVKAVYNMMVAHFAARHFETCKKLLPKIISDAQSLNTVLPSLKRLVKIRHSDLEGYKLALNVGKDTHTNTKISDVKTWNKSANAFVSLAALGEACPPNLHVTALKHGFCVSRKLIIKLENDTFLAEFLEAVAKELPKAGSSSKMDKLIRARMLTALYFLCALSPKFSDSILMHPLLKEADNWRPLATQGTSSIPPVPTNQSLQALTESGPPLWDILTSFNLDVVRKSFLSLGVPFRLPYRHHFSVLIGDAILKKCGTRNYDKVVIQLWKLEQLVTLNNSNGWRAMINIFASALSDVMASNPELSELLAYDLVRVEIDVFNRRLYRTDASDFGAMGTSVMQITRNFAMRAIQTGNIAFVKFILPVINFLFNNRQWKYIMDVLNDRCFKCNLTDFARLLASYFYYLFEEKNVPTAAKIATTPFWTNMWPTFEAVNPNSRRQAPLLITRPQLLDFLTLLKEGTAIDFFFGYTCFLFNSALPAAMEEAHPVPSIAISNFKRIFNNHELVWKSLTFDANCLDVGFIESVIEILCKNAIVVNPINANWLRICGDFCFAKERWNEAVTYYLEVIAATHRGFTSETGIVDSMYTKISIALASLKMPTLAAIVGQLKTNIESHLLQVEWLLQGTHNTVDSGPAYFSLIADVNLLECMAAAYTKLGLPIYVQSLLKAMPTKAINPNNSPQVLQREVERRKKRFLDILFNQFFKQNL